MKHTIIYMRVSTAQQTTDSQEPDLERWVNAQAPESLGKVIWYSDVGTGKHMNRQGWRKAQTWIDSGTVINLVVWRLDRLGRTVKGMAELMDTLKAKKVNLISLKEGIDLTTAAGRLMIDILSSFAAYETEVRGERVMAGQAAARVKGVKIGGSKAGVIHKVTPERVAAIYHLRDTGSTYKQIAKAVGLCIETVRQVLIKREKTLNVKVVE